MKKQILHLIILLFAANAAFAQTFTTPQTRNIKTIITNKLPIQTGVEPTLGASLPNYGANAVSPLFAGGLWVGSYDKKDQSLRLACSTYRSSSKNDFWAGPITGEKDSLKLRTLALNFDKVWAVSRFDIEAHKKDLLDGKLDSPIKSIMEWAGKGNPYFKEYNGFDLPMLPSAKQDFAPFKDVDKDGIYNPAKGDFPLPLQVSELNIPEMTYWSISNDAADKHTNTNTNSISIEIHKTIWSYACENSPAYANAIYGSYKIINRSAVPRDSFFVAQFSDFDLSCFETDHVGTNVIKNSAYQYSSVTSQDVCKYSPTSVGKRSHSATAFTFLNKKIYASIFYQNASSSTSPSPATTDPNVSIDFYKYMNGKWKDGTDLINSGNGYNYEPWDTAKITTKFQYDGNPTNNSGWIDTTYKVKINHDYRSVLSTYIGSLAPDASTTIDFAYTGIVTDTTKTTAQALGSLFSAIDLVQAAYNDGFSKNCNNTAYCVGKDCVYPGDTNNDGIVNTEDFHNIYLYEAEKGTPRALANSTFAPQTASNWGVKQLTALI
jgi:hypothetical protein